MNKLYLASIVSFLCFSASAEPVTVGGKAICDRTTPRTCRVAWTFDSLQQAAYSVEQFDPKTKRWIPVYGPVTERTGITQEPMTEGSLYRGIACGDKRKCVVTSTIWAPLHPVNTEAMPDSVQRKNGIVMTVSKNVGDYESMRQQYNVYMLTRLLEDVDNWTIMPPMTSPPQDPLTSPPEWIDDDFIHFAVYGQYEGARNAKSVP